MNWHWKCKIEWPEIGRKYDGSKVKEYYKEEDYIRQRRKGSTGSCDMRLTTWQVLFSAEL